MTQEEKAKAYDEAVKRAKAAIDMAADKDLVGGVVRTIFPELAESEDESIRKLLIWQVHRNIEDETNDLAQSVYDGIKGHDPDLEESIEDWKKCLAYLEKQKEQKPTEQLGGTFTSYDMAKTFTEGQNYVIAHPEKFDLCKPAEWSEEDEAMRDNILRLLSCFVGTLECDSNPSLSTSYPAYQREMDWLKSLRPSWKPSEEQMGALRRAVNNLAKTDVADSVRLSIMYDNLKKL